MDGDIVDQVTSWESKPFSNGYSGLRDLENDGFSGAVSAAGTWLFFLNGNVLGVFDGSIDDLEGADGTIYTAPGVALPLLFAMREQGGEQQSQYYTEDTPIEEVDATLSDGNFTGYVELSENVLSGDYYVAYYGGRSLPAAFVGNQPEVITGEDAFERAADEVGIYEVIKVPIDVHDIPEPTEDNTSVSGVVTEAESDTDEDTDQSTTESTPEPEEDSDAPTTTETNAETEPTATEPTDETSTTPSEPQPDDQQQDEPSPDESQPTPTEQSSSPTTIAESSGQTDERDERFDEEAEWRETRTIPSLSPSDSDPNTDQESTQSQPTSSARNQSPTPTDSTDPDNRKPTDTETAEREELQHRIDTLATERDRAQARQEELEQQLTAIREERDQLADRVETLEQQIEAGATTPEDTTGSVGDTMSATEALSQTNLFIRYGSKGDATLEAVPEGASAEEVNSNLQLDYHTQFDADNVTIEGESFQSFLEQTPEYAFVEWVVRELPFEIRETDHEKALVDLYGAIQQIDRAELDGVVSSQTEDGEVRGEYDVVLRGRKGDPLIVADINDSRDPVTGDMMEDLVELTSGVAAEIPSVATAMSVTASFFKPEALEVAEEVTGGGFLSRDARVSFVRTSRKQGYHLCLVESRKGSFHVTVPEL